MTEIKTHPILFKGEMVRAILDDRKSQTSGVITPRNSLLDGGPWDKRSKAANPDWDNAYVDPGPSPAGNPGPYLKLPFPEFGTTHRVYPRIQVGDHLWVRETFTEVLTRPFDNDSGKVVYRADGWEGKDPDYPAKWKPSIHMPRKFSRITLEVTKLRVERVKDITVGGVIAEGVMKAEDIDPNTYPLDLIFSRSDCYDPWKKLWDSIYAKRGYSLESDPWIFIYEFATL